MWNTLLFVVVPYLTVAIAVAGGIARYRSDRFSYSSQSSQFLESKTLFWGSVFWHYGILAILGAHVLAVVLWDPTTGQEREGTRTRAGRSPSRDACGRSPATRRCRRPCTARS